MAFDAFLKIDGVDGESTDDKHKNWIEILSFNWGLSQPASGSASSGGGRSSERVTASDFSIVKTVDKASPKLAEAVAKGTHIGEIKLEVCRNTGEKEKYLEYVMKDVLISSWRPGGSAQGGESLPLEEVSFNPGEMKVTYVLTDQKTGKAGGNVQFGWSFVNNKSV